MIRNVRCCRVASISSFVCGQRVIGYVRAAIAAAIVTCGAACAVAHSDAYELGQQVYRDQDFKTALNEFTIAAESGNTRAQIRIADMYYQGRQVPKNYVLAYAWFHLAMDARPDLVAGREATIELLELSMNPRELEQGKAELARLNREVADSAEASAQWHSVSPGQADLVVSVPTLEPSRGVYSRRVDGFVVKETAVWSDAEISQPTAAIALVKIKSIGPKSLVFTRDTSLGDDIRKLLPGAQVPSALPTRMSNRIGDGEYLRFTRDGTRECVFLRQYADTFADQRGYTRSFKPSAGNIVLRAWYCAPVSATLSHESIEAFVNGLAIKGFSVQTS